MKRKRIGEIRSGKHTYAYHEVDIDKNTRLIVQENGRGWYAYKWTNPPSGGLELVDHERMTEAQALEWLKGQVGK